MKVSSSGSLIKKKLYLAFVYIFKGRHVFLCAKTTKLKNKLIQSGYLQYKTKIYKLKPSFTILKLYYDDSFINSHGLSYKLRWILKQSSKVNVGNWQTMSYDYNISDLKLRILRKFLIYVYFYNCQLAKFIERSDI